MSSRLPWAIAASIAGMIAIVASVVWLASRSDATLARWSAIAGVISAMVAVSALVVAVIPLWQRDDSRKASAGHGNQARRAPGTVIKQDIRGGRDVNVVGQGSQNIVNITYPQDRDR